MAGITIAQTAPPDSLDPALAFEVASLEPLWLVYTPLLTYRRAEGEEGAELVPGLASDLPEISADGTHLHAHPAQGPHLLGRERGRGERLRARDQARPDPRLGRRPRSTRGSRAPPPTRGTAIPAPTSAGSRPTRRAARSRSGSREPDATFANALALVFAGLVPGDTPFRDMSADPPAGRRSVRDHRVRARPRVGARAQPGLRRPRHPRHPDRQPRADHDQDRRQRARARRGRARRQARLHAGPAARRTSCGRSASRPPTATSSTPPPPPTTSSSTSGGRRSTTRWSARRSTGRSTARRSRRRYGGLMEPGCTLLAPGVPGYDERLDTDGCPYGDPSDPPDTAPRPGADPPGRGQGRAGHGLGQQGSRLAAGDRGLRANAERDRPRRPHEAGRPGLLLRDDQRPAQRARRPASTPGSRTSPIPLDFFVVVDGDSIQPVNNPNPGNVDDPLIDSEIDRLRGVADLDSVVDDWQQLDAYLISPPQSYLAPFGHKRVATFFSERMDPEELDLPSALPQRLLELEAEAGRIGPIGPIKGKVRPG